MLPNRMLLDRQTEEQLKRLKSQTGLTPNVASRAAFFRSVESGYRYHGDGRKLDGAMILDKVTWLGETSLVIELVLKLNYPSLDSKELMRAWAAHVEDGISALRNHKSVYSLANSIHLCHSEKID